MADGSESSVARDEDLADLVHSRLAEIEADLASIRISKVAEPSVAVSNTPYTLWSWLTCPPKTPRGLVYIEWSGNPFNVGSLQSVLLDEVIVAGWCPCRMESQADAVLLGSLSERDRTSTYSIHEGAVGGLDIKVFDLAAVLSASSRSHTEPTAVWEAAASTPSSFSTLQGSFGSALKEVRENLQSRIRGELGPALEVAKEKSRP